MKSYLLSLLCLLFPLLLQAQAQMPAKPDPLVYVNDFASILNKEQQTNLHRKLLDAYRNNNQKFQIVIVTVNNMGGQDIKSYSQYLAQSWGIGQKGKDNGILILMAKTERKVRIEVGYGLEDKVTDIQTARIINNLLTPEFKKGQFYLGFSKAIDELIQLLDGQLPVQRAADSIGTNVALSAVTLFPKPIEIRYVNDNVNFFDKDSRYALSKRLERINELTQEQLSFVIIANSYSAGAGIEEHAQQQLQLWGLMPELLPNFVCIVLLKDEKEAYISVGNNHKAKLPDSILNQNILVRLRGDYQNPKTVIDVVTDIFSLYGGDVAALKELEEKRAAEWKAKKDAEKASAQRSKYINSTLGLLFLLFLIWIYLRSRAKNREWTRTYQAKKAAGTYLDSSNSNNTYSDSNSTKTTSTYSDYSDRSSYSDSSYSDSSSYSDYSDSSSGGGSFGGGGADGSW